jgi:hypothetical protein
MSIFGRKMGILSFPLPLGERDRVRGKLIIYE